MVRIFLPAFREKPLVSTTVNLQSEVPAFPSGARLEYARHFNSPTHLQIGDSLTWIAQLAMWPFELTLNDEYLQWEPARPSEISRAHSQGIDAQGVWIRSVCFRAALRKGQNELRCLFTPPESSSLPGAPVGSRHWLLESRLVIAPLAKTEQNNG